MASLKIASLLLRTLSKPIANKIKQQAKEHDGFKTRTVQMAQWLHRAEYLRVRLLGESPKHVRPLSEARAIDAGANFLSEGFLFSVAATIIIGETYRSRRADSKRRDQIKDSLAAHEEQLKALNERLGREKTEREEAEKRERELEKIVEEIVLIGLHGGFGELPSDWQRHLRVGRLAQEFGTAGRVLREDDDDADGADERDGDLLGAEAGEAIEAVLEGKEPVKLEEARIGQTEGELRESGVEVVDPKEQKAAGQQ
ncbi:hypothetical protein JCM8097_003706 [Rhodosporidiobolus ruineniae]